MPSHFTLRMQFGPHQDPEEVTAWLLKLAKEAPVDEVTVFFFAEEMNDGHDTLERIDQWIARSRPYRLALAEAGVAISLNPWQTMLHADRGRSFKPGQDWQPMVSPTGQEAQAQVCPLEEGWQSYYAESLRRYAREGFRVIWIDDDIRYHNHGPLEWGGCFCPRHVAEFNRRADTQATREEIVAACTAPGEPHPWRAIWLDMWQDTLLRVIDDWRGIVEAEGGRIGLMSSGFEAHAAEGRRWADWWKTFAGDKPPVHRPCFWGYGDGLGQYISDSIAMLDQNRGIQHPGTESGPEIENFPYGAWNKSYRQTGAQIALAHVLGSTNLNISLYDFMGNAPDDEPGRVDFLRRWRPACDWLADTFPMSLRPDGVGLPWSEEMGRRVHTEWNWSAGVSPAHWNKLICPHRGWASWLGGSGISFTMRPQTVNALCGAGVWAFSDDELRGWLAGGLLLDGAAAGILIERGFGELIGLRAASFITQQDRVFSVEHTLDAAFGLRVGAEMSVNGKPYSERLLQADLLPGARLASDLRGPKNDVLGHGLVLFDNALGGRVATVPWNANTGAMLNPQRAAQLHGILRYLDPQGTAGSVQGGAWLIPQFLTDGATWRGAVWNGSPDELDAFTLTPPAGMPLPTQAIQITARGERIPATIEGNVVKLSRPLYEWELVALL